MKFLMQIPFSPLALTCLFAIQLSTACRGPEDDSPDAVAQASPAPRDGNDPEKQDNNQESQTQSPRSDGLPESQKVPEPKTTLEKNTDLKESYGQGEQKNLTNRDSKELKHTNPFVFAALVKIEAAKTNADSAGTLERAWHEMSLQGERITSLESAVAVAKSAVHPQVVAVETNDSEIVLKLTRDYVFSFSKYSDSKKIKLVCNGFDLKIVGDNFENVFVDGKTVNGKQSRVTVVSSGQWFPAVNVSGEDGKQGYDAHCPPGYETCLLDDAPSFPQASTEFVAYPDSSESIAPAEIIMIPGLGVVGVGLFQIGPEPDFGLTSGNILNRTVLKVAASGNVKTIRTWTAYRFANGGPTNGQNAQGIAAQNGGNGSAGGSVLHYFVDQTADNLRREKIPLVSGGKGGLAGRSGLILAGAGSAAATFSENETQRQYLVNASLTWQLDADIVTYSHPVKVDHVTITKPGTFLTTEWESPFHALKKFEFPAGLHGTNGSRPVATNGTNGADGTLESQKIEHLNEFFTLAGEGLPLPESMAKNLSEKIMAEKFKVD